VSTREPLPIHLHHDGTVGGPASLTARDVLGIVARRLWIVVLIMAASLGIAYYVSTHTPQRWKATASLLVVPRTISPTSQNELSVPVAESMDTHVLLLQGREIAHRAVDELRNEAIHNGRSPDSVGITDEALRKQLSVSVPAGTSVIEVSVEGANRNQAMDLANLVCDTYVKYKKDKASTNAKETITELEGRARRAREQMLAADRAEIAFKRRHHMTDVPLQISAAITQYMAQDATVSSLKQDLFSQEAKFDGLSDRLKDANLAIKGGTGVRDDTMVVGLQQQLNSLEIERAKMALKYTADFPGGLPDLDKQIDDIKGRLSAALQATLDNRKPSLQSQGALVEDYKQAKMNVLFTRAKLQAAVQVRDQLRAATGNLPQASIEYARMSKNAETSRTLYTSLQAALQSINVDKDMTNANVQLYYPAFSPEEPFLPNRTKDLTYGGAIGLFLALVGVLLLEQSDTRLRRLDQIRRLVPGPVVGALPRLMPWQASALTGGRQLPQVAETYGLLRANLGLMLRRQTGKDPWKQTSIMITSALPGEGKSLTSAELARSLARAGQRVILVDADMRRPMQNRLFQSAEAVGLAEVLVDHATLDDTLVETDTPGLLVLHSGTPDRNPTELLSLPRLGETIAALQTRTDVVLIDTPACSAVADALFMAPYVDCIVHVVRAGMADSSTEAEAIAGLQAANPRGLAFFVNSAPRERHRAYSYYLSRTATAARPQPAPAAPRKALLMLEALAEPTPADADTGASGGARAI
jgi:polysaccharide biosynthesis transport protein